MPVSVGSKKQDLAVSEHGNLYEVGALSVLQALISEEESSINRKLRSATNSRQTHSDNEEHGSRAEHRKGNERHQRWGYRQNDRHSSSRRHYNTHKQGQGQPIGNATAWSMDLCLVKLDAPLDKPVCLGADFEKCTGPFYVVHCVNNRHEVFD